MLYIAIMKPGILYIVLILFICNQSCSKTMDEKYIPCSEKIIGISVVSAASSGCGNNSGFLIVTATGSNGFTFRINSGPFQPSGSIMNLSNGTYNITARDEDGCEQTTQTLVASGIVAGPKFTDLKNLFVLRCNRCHGGTSPAALKDWSVDCTILDYKQLINNRAVVTGDMPKGGPELSAAEKNIITEWLTAGGLIEN